MGEAETDHQAGQILIRRGSSRMRTLFAEMRTIRSEMIVHRIQTPNEEWLEEKQK